MIARTVSAFLFAIFLADGAQADQSHSLGGMASVYGYGGQKTASGEIASPAGLTAAHRTLPFGTRVRVTHARTGKSVVVRINDRGPFVKGRVIDLSPQAASVLGFRGLAPVRLAIVD